MKRQDREALLQAAADSFEEMLRRSWECSELDMELKSAIERKDVEYCRGLLREKGGWLARFKGHEFAELMDAAIHTGETAGELVSLLLESGAPAHSVVDHHEEPSGIRMYRSVPPEPFELTLAW